MYLQGSYQAAIDLLESTTQPKDKEIYQKVVFYRGLELFNEVQYQPALAYLQKVKGNDTFAARALYWSGECAYQLKDFSGSQKHTILRFSCSSEGSNHIGILKYLL
ncbi:hypothetical protein CCAN11_2490082 [Capnocytophaga canimorsus]|uniref:Tetratricopeptide repeat protein n=1 Tax=Capnocytophaga canimorsus TaxID=28188 RepID=A0A0B7ILP2_9FLAO|nr:hypothetical protein CCAN11_2490082 [Capnocytophaga canimorsus]